MTIDPTAAANLDLLKAEIAAGAVVAGALIASLVGTIGAGFIARNVQRERNRQDRESQWRTHAVELTKLDFDRLKLAAGPNGRLRPLILTFLANYRDLQELGQEELGTKSPRELFLKIKADRIDSGPDRPTQVVTDDRHAVVSCAGFPQEGHPRVFFVVGPNETVSCPYCSREYIIPNDLL